MSSRVVSHRTFKAFVLICAVILTTVLSPSAWPQGKSDPPTVRVGGDVKPPIKTKTVPPVYPQIAQTAKVQGVVIVEATIGVDGKVKDVKVIRSVKMLDDAAIAAVKQWTFKPTVIDGHPVQVIMTIPVNFLL